MSNLQKKNNKTQIQGDSDLVNQVDLPDDKIGEVLSKAGGKIIADNIPIFNKFFGAIEKVNSEIREEKLKILLSSFQSHFDSIDEAFAQFSKIFKNRAGIILFQKIIHILDQGDADEEWIDLLGNVLNSITADEVEKHFEEKSYILSQIARLSPQALLILSKGDNWGSVKFTGSTTMSNQTIVGDWDSQAAIFFASQVNITDEEVKLRISHTFRELESNGMIYVTPSKSLGCTQIGARVQSIVTKT